MSRVPKAPTADEIWKEIEALQEESGIGFTTRELARAWGVSEKTARNRIRSGVEGARLAVGRKMVAGLNGPSQPAACYSIKR